MAVTNSKAGKIFQSLRTFDFSPFVKFFSLSFVFVMHFNVCL